MFFRITRGMWLFFYINILRSIYLLKKGKIKIYQYFDYSVVEKNVPIKISKTVESYYVYRRIHNICIQSQI